MIDSMKESWIMGIEKERGSRRWLVVLDLVVSIGLYGMGTFDPNYKQKKGVSQGIIWDDSVSSRGKCKCEVSESKAYPDKVKKKKW